MCVFILLFFPSLSSEGRNNAKITRKLWLCSFIIGIQAANMQPPRFTSLQCHSVTLGQCYGINATQCNSRKLTHSPTPVRVMNIFFLEFWGKVHTIFLHTLHIIFLSLLLDYFSNKNKRSRKEKGKYPAIPLPSPQPVAYLSTSLHTWHVQHNTRLIIVTVSPFTNPYMINIENKDLVNENI